MNDLNLTGTINFYFVTLIESCGEFKKAKLGDAGVLDYGKKLLESDWMQYPGLRILTAKR